MIIDGKDQTNYFAYVDCVGVPYHMIKMRNRATTMGVVKEWSYFKRYIEFKNNYGRQRRDLLVRVLIVSEQYLLLALRIEGRVGVHRILNCDCFI